MRKRESEIEKERERERERERPSLVEFTNRWALAVFFSFTT